MYSIQYKLQGGSDFLGSACKNVKYKNIYFIIIISLQFKHHNKVCKCIKIVLRQILFIQA